MKILPLVITSTALGAIMVSLPFEARRAAAPLTPTLSRRVPACAPDNAGLKLADGFCALLVAENLGAPRHLAVAPNGDVYVARYETKDKPGGIVVLHDVNGDGKAEEVQQYYQGSGGTGIFLANDALYFASDDQVLRFSWKVGDLKPSAPPVVVASGLPSGGHGMKGIAMGRDGMLYVSFGSQTNSCQEKDRRDRVPGVNPCVERDRRAGVWRFDPKRVNQSAADGHHFAIGLRNPEAISVEPKSGMPWMATHGRDQLTENWGFTAEAGRENPAEEFGPLTDGIDYGWPYCYYDPRAKKKVQTPEYGGDGQKVGDCANKAVPAIGFPAHWAPNATVFYTGKMFPPEYQGGVFIAFHGSWNRGPRPEDQQGYRVVFAPFKDGKVVGTYSTFVEPVGKPQNIRPSGLAVGPDGSLYIGADAQGKVWRVMRSAK